MFKTFLAATAVAAFALPAHAVTVAQWNFESATAPSSSSVGPWLGIAPSIGSGSASGVHAASTATWSTPAGNGSTKSASGNLWAVGDYWEFSLSTAGFAGVSLSFDQTGSNTGPRDFTLVYSTNGTTFTTFASYAIANITWGSTTPVTTSTFTYDLSSVAALNNTSTALFRLVDASTVAINGAAVAAGGTNRVDNFTVIATPVPEPGTYALLLAGMAAVGFVARRRTV